MAHPDRNIIIIIFTVIPVVWLGGNGEARKMQS